MDGEIIARVERRRQWTPQEKAALLAEVEASAGRVSVVARRHGISKSLLYNWRSAWKAAALVARGAAPSRRDLSSSAWWRIPHTRDRRCGWRAVRHRPARGARAQPWRSAPG